MATYTFEYLPYLLSITLFSWLPSTLLSSTTKRLMFHTLLSHLHSQAFFIRFFDFTHFIQLTTPREICLLTKEISMYVSYFCTVTYAPKHFPHFYSFLLTLFNHPLFFYHSLYKALNVLLYSCVLACDFIVITFAPNFFSHLFCDEIFSVLVISSVKLISNKQYRDMPAVHISPSPRILVFM